MLEIKISTRDKLLQFASSLIQQNGFEGFSYADLSRKLGIKKSSIHHHFPTKNDLGIAYCEQKVDLFSKLEQKILNNETGIEQLKIYFDDFLDCAKNHEMCGVYAMLSDSSLFSTTLKDAVNHLAAYELSILTGILQRGQDSGKLRLGISPQNMSVIVCSALKGSLLLNRIPPHNACENTVKSLIKILSL